MFKKKAPLSLAVAGASLLFVEQGVTADITVANPASCLADLRAAITAVDSAAGDMVIIDPAACPEITVTGESILITDKPLILSAPVDAQGRPQVSITAGSGTNFGLFTLDDTTAHASISDAVNARIPIIFSGLELTGATNDGPGGAIYANNHAVVLDKSTVSNNTAVGSGGGIAVRGDLCIIGSEITGNTVTHTIETSGFGDDKYVSAVGGGAAVRGSVFVGVAGSDSYLSAALGAGNCLSDDASHVLSVNATPAFAAAAATLNGLPEGVDVVASQISGNTVDAQVVLADLDPYASFVVGGGGLAIMSDGVRRESLSFGTAGGSLCSSYTPGVSGDNCLLAAASSVDANEVSLIIDETGAQEDSIDTVIAGGGGIAVFKTTYDSLQSAIAYSSVSGNTVTVSVPDGTTYYSLISGGGFSSAVLPPVGLDIIPLWGETYGSNDEVSGGKYSAIVGANAVLGSVVSGNTIEVQGVGNQYGGSISIVTGGGLGAIDFTGSGLGAIKYANSLTTVLSSVSGNTVDVAVAGSNFVDVTGGGLGTILFTDYASPFIAGKYFSVFSSASGNAVEVTGITTGKVGGGGGAGSFIGKIYQKPQFTVVDEQALLDSKYGIGLGVDLVSLWTDPGGVVDNTVDVTVGATANAAVVAMGGGSLLGQKYNFSFQVATTLSRNSVTVDASAATGGVVSAVGGGAGAGAVSPIELVQFHSIKYASVDDNAVAVTAPATVDVLAAGGGLGLLERVTPLADNKYTFVGNANVVMSTVSGNTVAASGSPDSRAIGGGLALQVAGDYGPFKYDIANVKTSTIAENALSLTGGGDVSGGGLFAEMHPDLGGSYETLGVDKVTVVGNTSSIDGVASGGQVYLGSDYDSEDTEYASVLLNSLVSGNTAQGDRDVYYDNPPYLMAGTAVFHGPEVLRADALAPEVADPAYLGDLQFNGGLGSGGSSKYGLSYNKTIALLVGSGAIDAGPGPGAYYATKTCGVEDLFEDDIGLMDQRGNNVVGDCADVGAYEFTGESDGDGLTDGTELVGAATDLTLGNQRTSAPGLVVALPSGDGNSDGIPDVNQSEVATFTYGSRVVTLATFQELTTGGAVEKEYLSTAGNIEDVEGVAPTVGSVAIDGSAYDLDFGVSFTADTSDGEDEQFELIIDSGIRNVVLVKQVCDPDSASLGEWRMLDNTPEPFGSGRIRFTFTVTEGGDYDCNGDGGGISDPAYVATYDVVPVPTMPWFMVGILSGLSALGGLLGIRRQRKAGSRKQAR